MRRSRVALTGGAAGWKTTLFNGASVKLMECEAGSEVGSLLGGNRSASQSLSNWPTFKKNLIILRLKCRSAEQLKVNVMYHQVTGRNLMGDNMM